MIGLDLELDAKELSLEQTSFLAKASIQGQLPRVAYDISKWFEMDQHKKP
jgi:hypothetical protein